MSEPAALDVHDTQVRVRYCETDAMGLLHHGSYINYFEIARTELFRAQGGDAAKRHVESLIKKWLQDYQDWDPVAWQPDVIAQRLIAWMSNASMAVSTQDLVHHSAVMSSMARP